MKTVSLITASLLIAASQCGANTRECGQPERPLPADIDATTTPPCSEVWDSSSVPSSVATSPLGRYRVLGGRFRDRMAYLFRTANAGDLIRLTITYPDDAPRNAEIFAFSQADQSYGQTFFGTGYFTGGAYPVTNRMIEQTFYFHAPGSGRFAIALMTAAVGRSAALARMKVEVASGEPPDLPAEAKDPGRRKIGMYWEDHVFEQNFAELSVPRMSAAQHDVAFRTALDRHVAYMKRIGHNLVIDPVVWYQSTEYQPSAEYRPDGPFHNLRPPDADRWMADRYSREGFDFWPSIRNWSLPSLADWVKPAAEVASGTAGDYVNTVDKDGRVQTKSAWHSPPMLNALHPRVQAALRNLIAEIMDRIGGYESVKGISLWTTTHSSHGLGTVDQSYDDYTLRAFSKDTGIALPELNGPPEERFRKWSGWLRASHWEQWIAWRKRKQTELYSTLADIVAKKKPGAKLNLMVFYPVPTMNVGLTVDDQKAYLDGIGFDLDALSRNPNIVISRLTLAHQYELQLRTKPADTRGMPELLARSRLDFSPDWQRPFIGKASGTVIQYCYFEQNLAKSERMHPDGWHAPEPGWHVTSPKAAGRNALEYIIRSIALYDPKFVAYGGFQMGPQGMEQIVAPIAAAFTTLPAVPFSTVSDQDGVVVREAVVNGWRWAYAVNATPEERTAAVAAQSVKLAPWDLRVFKTRVAAGR